MKNYLQRILTASVYDVANQTPLTLASNLSRRFNNRILLKREDMQPVFSFKLRGAYNCMVKLSDAEKARGVICSSAGNHAQGVALSAQKLGIKATIVMPRTTPAIKVDAVRQWGGRVVLHGDNYDAAKAHAEKLTEERGLTPIPPFDHPDVIAGQGTVGMEILSQHPGPIHAVFVPTGGGGLIAGIAAYIKQLRPDIRIISVEPEDAPTLERAMAAGRRVTLDEVGIFADGVAVKQIGKEPFRIARELVDECLLVSTDEICAGIKDIFEDTRTVMEPAGALAVAGIKKYIAQTGITDATLIGINCGANMNFSRLAHVAERAELGEHREAVLAVTIPERPGSFKDFCETIGNRPITEFNYRYAAADEAHVFAGIGLTNGLADRDEVVAALEEKGYPVLDLTDDEMSKVHVRHMVGGHAQQVADEVLYHVRFPERPGALLNFLKRLGKRWNISLFHYRNHGADYGRVLVGVQVPPAERADFKASLDKLGYPYRDESSNPAYALFLS